jgi:hypothetical protein
MILYTIVFESSYKREFYNEPLDDSSDILWSSSIDISLCYSSMESAYNALNHLKTNALNNIKHNNTVFNHTACTIHSTFMKHISILPVVFDTSTSPVQFKGFGDKINI